jgi:hypothetical protein
VSSIGHFRRPTLVANCCLTVVSLCHASASRCGCLQSYRHAKRRFIHPEFLLAGPGVRDRESNGAYAATAELVTNDGGLPGSVVATFSVPAIAPSFPSFGRYTLTPNSNATLAANTDYWVVLDDSGSGVLHWGGSIVDGAFIFTGWGVHDGSECITRSSFCHCMVDACGSRWVRDVCSP